MSKHTPGPWPIDWYVCREGKKELWRVPRSIGPVFVDHNYWAGNHLYVDSADAHLIAAAPLLYEALKDIAGTDPVDAALDPQRAVRIARAAIKAVEGEGA